MNVAQLCRIDIENTHVGAHTRSNLSSRGAGSAGSENYDFARSHTRRATEKYTASTVFRLQAPGADLNRHSARDLTHRRQERQRSVFELNGFVGNGRDFSLEQRSGNGFAGR